MIVKTCPQCKGTIDDCPMCLGSGFIDTTDQHELPLQPAQGQCVNSNTTNFREQGKLASKNMAFVKAYTSPPENTGVAGENDSVFSWSSGYDDGFQAGVLSTYSVQDQREKLVQQLILFCIGLCFGIALGALI